VGVTDRGPGRGGYVRNGGREGVESGGMGGGVPDGDGGWVGG